MNGFAGLQSMNQVGNLGNFEESLSLKLNSNDAINTSVSCSARSNMQGHNHSEHEKPPHSRPLN